MIEGGGKVKSAQSSLSDKCSLMCSLADSSLTLMMKEIFDGSVTFKDMEFILERQVEVERLCAASEAYELDEVQVFLRRRKNECAAFRDYKARLDSFCSKLVLSKLQITGEIKVFTDTIMGCHVSNRSLTFVDCNCAVMYIVCVDLPDLLKEIKQDHSDCPIKTLCCAQESLQDVQYLRFTAAQPLQQILPAFYILSSQYPSELFQQIWKLKLRVVASEKLTLTFVDIVTKIWEPILKECCQLIKGVRDLTITLAAVNDHFRNLDEKQYHLELLFKATEECSGRQVESTTWIRKAIDRMRLYWNLCEQADAAKTVLELKESLKLEGNFEVIENVAGAFTTSVDKQTLNGIDQRLIEMSSFLEHFTKDRKKLESLKSFAACLDIVEWIRKESQGTYITHNQLLLHMYS